MQSNPNSVFLDGFKSWKKERNQTGTMAISRYVMSVFVDELNRLFPEEYILKGGNLLWHYIKTPRPTVDLDLTTLTRTEAELVLADIKKVQSNGITFSINRSEVKQSNMSVGLQLRISYETDSGQNGIFGIDCVLACPTDVAQIIFLKKEVAAASIENIILDKLHACHRFAEGNTRMKDFDDLYRIAVDTGVRIRSDILKNLAEYRRIELKIKPQLSDYLAPHWDKYTQRRDYPAVRDLPKSIWEVIEIINLFLKGI